MLLILLDFPFPFVYYSIFILPPFNLYAGKEVTSWRNPLNIVITLKNFFDVGNSHGDYYYTPIKENGIPASEHVLIIKSCLCRDDAKDNDGNFYYFYMVDRSKGLKALITEKALDPTEDLDEYIYELAELVKAEMRKDGGIVAIIEKFKQFSAGR